MPAAVLSPGPGDGHNFQPHTLRRFVPGTPHRLELSQHWASGPRSQKAQHLGTGCVLEGRCRRDPQSCACKRRASAAVALVRSRVMDANVSVEVDTREQRYVPLLRLQRTITRPLVGASRQLPFSRTTSSGIAGLPGGQLGGRVRYDRHGGGREVNCDDVVSNDRPCNKHRDR